MGRVHISHTSKGKHESEGSCTQIPKKSLAEALRSTTTICQVFVFAEEVEGGTPSFLKSPLQVAYELQLFRKNTSFSGFPGSKMLPSAVCSVAGTESSLCPSLAGTLLWCHIPDGGQGRRVWRGTTPTQPIDAAKTCERSGGPPLATTNKCLPLSGWPAPMLAPRCRAETW